MSDLHSDAFVFFGASGDLAYKKIFPSLHSMVKRGTLDMPVIGVAKSNWSLDQFRARAYESIDKHGGVDRVAFDKLCGLLRYVGGDYKDPATFKAVRRELGSCSHPAHYLAIPPVLFGSVVEELGKAGCAKGARIIVEKPFGTDLISARSPQCDSAQHVRGERRFPHRSLSRQATGSQHALRTFCEFVAGELLVPWPCRKRADNHGRKFRNSGSRRFL